MRSLLLCLSLLALASCGNSGSGGSAKDKNTESIIGYLDLSSGLVGSSDLLTVTMDVPVAICGDKITFTADRSGVDAGNTISCSLAYKNGETYSYSVNASSLVLQSSNGKTYNMTRSGNNGTDIVGTWTWSGDENGMSIHRRISIPNTSRFIVNQDCES